MPEEPERLTSISGQNIAFQRGDGNVQNNTYNFSSTNIIQISVDVIKTRKFNPISPYKGLKKFETTSEDSKHFFGRDRLIRILIGELENSNVLLLLGASGSGKSSVIQAGVIPRLQENFGSSFIPFILKPDRDPFLSLFAALSVRYGQDLSDVARSERGNTLIEVVANLKEENSYWLIYLDQFEEIFHLSDPTKADSFIRALIDLSNNLEARKDFSVKIVMTMRVDFLEKFSAYPELKEITITQKHLEMITDMTPDELRQVIEQPAAQNGVVFEDGLVKEMIDEVRGQPGYLPLLQYTLDLLWKEDSPADDRTLSTRTYRELGGVRGALQKHVEAIYTALSDREREAMREIFFKLVDVEVNQELGTLRKAVSKRAKRAEFQGELIQVTLKKLIDNNLLVSNKSEVTIEADATIEIAHEILLNSWDTLRRWIESAYQAISLKNDILKSLYRWRETKKKDPKNADRDFLTGSLLEEARKTRDGKTFDVLGGLTLEENQFIDDSFAHSEWRREEKLRIARGIAAGASVAVVISKLFVI